MTIRVKICGITRSEDAIAAAQAGADAIGLVFYAGSKRVVNIEKAREIVEKLPAFVSVVALFVNADENEIREVLKQVPIDLIQFHGDETDDFCQQFNHAFIKAIRVKDASDIQKACQEFPHARALLFDAYHPHEYGGTGQSFDWKLLPESLDKPWVLAGGLTADCVAEAIDITGALAVDVSGGVESAPGIKDPEKMAQFITQAKNKLSC